MPLEVFGTVQHVDRGFQRRGRRSIIGTGRFRLVRQPFLRSLFHLSLYLHPAFTGRRNERIDKAWNLQVRLDTVLIVIDSQTAASVVIIVRRPFVGTVYTQIQPFPATEGIALGKTDNALGTVSAACLSFSIRLYIEVVRLVEQAVYLHVEHTTRVRSVTGSEGETRGSKDPTGSQLPLALLMQFMIVQRARPHLQVVGYGTHTERHMRPVVVHNDIAETPLLLQLLHKLTLQIDGNRPDCPRPQSTRIHRIGHLQTNGSLAMDKGRICKITGIAVLIIVVTVATEQFRDPFTLLFECRYIEGISLVDDRLVEVGRYQTVGRRCEIGVTHGVKRPQMSHVYCIAKACFLRIALCYALVAYLSVKITTLLQ